MVKIVKKKKYLIEKKNAREKQAEYVHKSH